MTRLTDNLTRSTCHPDSFHVRAAAAGTGTTLTGHFAVFNQWTEISSAREGRFLERVAPGAFADVFGDTRNTRVMYEHGAHPTIGTLPIADPKVLREDKIGAYYEAELFDTEYARQLLPALQAGQLGASFRFSVADQDWSQPTEASDHNPDRLEERTIRKVGRLYEFGPVTWGAYPEATSGVRSGTDEWFERLADDGMFAARMTELAGLNTVLDAIRSGTITNDARPGSTLTPSLSADSHSTREHLDRQADLVRLRSIVRSM